MFHHAKAPMTYLTEPLMPLHVSCANKFGRRKDFAVVGIADVKRRAPDTVGVTSSTCQPFMLKF